MTGTFASWSVPLAQAKPACSRRSATKLAQVQGLWRLVPWYDPGVMRSNSVSHPRNKNLAIAQTDHGGAARQRHWLSLPDPRKHTQHDWPACCQHQVCWYCVYCCCVHATQRLAQSSLTTSLPCCCRLLTPCLVLPHNTGQNTVAQWCWWWTGWTTWLQTTRRYRGWNMQHAHNMANIA